MGPGHVRGGLSRPRLQTRLHYVEADDIAIANIRLESQEYVALVGQTLPGGRSCSR